jgi:WD40 repeat protein
LKYDAIRVVRFSPDGSMLAAAGDDLAIRAWTVGNGSLVEPPKVLTGHEHNLWQSSCGCRRPAWPAIDRAA